MGHGAYRQEYSFLTALSLPVRLTDGIGNVQVDSRHLGQPTDVAFDSSADRNAVLKSWKAWADSCTANGTAAVVQINHPGRQSPAGAGKRSFFSKTLAPSPVPIQLGDGLLPYVIRSFVFGTPKEMTVDDIQTTIKDFADTAKLCAETGFAGVQIHAAHGYLLAQFLSPRTNKRTDAYGGTPQARAKIIVEIVHAIRAVTPSTFCVAIKLNSADHQSPSELQDCLVQLKDIAAAGVDFIEISGGSYENPTVSVLRAHEQRRGMDCLFVHDADHSGSQMNYGVAQEQKSESTLAREAFFIEFARAVRKDISDVPLMVTGGFRTRKGMEAAVAEAGCDLVGIARPAALQPTLPRDVLLNKQVSDADAVLVAPKVDAPWLLRQVGIKSLGAGIETVSLPISFDEYVMLLNASDLCRHSNGTLRN